MKKHCISYLTKSLIVCKLLLFFQNKTRIADSSDKEFIVISLFLHDKSILFNFTLILLKLKHYLITADLQIKTHQRVMLLYKIF